MKSKGTPGAPPDRTKRPPPQQLAGLVLPPVQKEVLSNGLPVWLVEQHRTPQVVLSIVILSGAASDGPGKSGTATLTAELLDAGTSARDALSISESVEFIGSTLSFRAGSDATFGTLLTLRRHLDEGIRLFADVIAHPVFPAAELERLRSQRLTSLIQMRDRPATLAGNAFMRAIYGDDHPYGKDASGTEESVSGLTRDDIASYYIGHYRPSNATLIVVGDTTMREVITVLERELGRWNGGAPGGAQPPAPAPSIPPRVYLIDRPGAPQSEIRIGAPALARNTPDYFPVTVMNRVLGGQFSSRINLNLREKRGYTYGARSTFVFLKNPGPFVVSGAFTGAKTAEAAEQLFLEIGAMHRGGVTDEELEFSKKGLTGSFALSFETPFQVAGALQSIVLYGLPEDYYEDYIQELGSVTREDVRRAALSTLDPAAMALLVVADANETRQGLGSLGRGPVVELDPAGSFLRGETTRASG
jgi:zinc protease